MSVTYRFKVSIQEKGKARHIYVEKSSFVIGRGKDADILLTDDLISREQIRVSHSVGNMWIEEMGSSNGTWLDGKKLVVHQKMMYRPGQQVMLGGKTGPHLTLECTVVEDVVTAYEVQPEDVVVSEWKENSRVANGSIGFGSQLIPPRAAPVPPVIKEKKLNIVPKNLDGAPEDKILKIKNQAEQNLFDHIRSLVGSEAEAIREACLAEAYNVKKQAEDFSTRHVQSAREQADRSLKEAEAYVQKKMNELKHYEAEAQKKLEIAQQGRWQAQKDVEGLKQNELAYRKTLAELQSTIQLEEKKIQEALSSLETQQHEFDAQKRDLELRIEEFELEERRTRAKIEAELEEVNLKLTRANNEAEKSIHLKQSLEPEIHSLLDERKSLHDKLSDLKKDLHDEEETLKTLTHEYSVTQQGLEEARREFENTRREIELKKEEVETTRLEAEHFHKEAHKALEEARSRADQMILFASDQVDKLTTEKDNLAAVIEKERAAKLLILDQEHKKIVKDHEHSISRLADKKSGLIKEMEKMAKSGHEEFHKIVNQAKADAVELKQAAHNEALTIRQSAEAEFKRIKADADKVMEKAEIEAKSRLEEARVDIQVEKDKFKQDLAQLELRKHSMEQDIVEARQRREDLLDTARNKVRETLATAESDALVLKNKMLDAAKIEAKQIMIQVDLEAKEQKAKIVSQMAELKHAEMMKIKEIRAQSEEEWIQRRLERSKGVATNLYALVASEMYKSRNKMMDDDFIESFTKEFKELVVDTMMDRVGPDTDKLQTILKTSSDAKEKEKKFWRKVKISSFSGVAVMAALILFPQILTIPRDKIVSAFVDKKENTGSDSFLTKIKEARVKAIYTPTTTVDHKSSYVENVLYTTDYVSKIQNAEFQDKWILGLNDYFIKTLDVKDTTIIKFVSLEATLLKDLEKLKSEVDPQNISVGIELMNKRENEFKQKLSEIFGDPNKVSRYYDFSGKFWNEYHNPRRPAAQQPAD